MDFTTTHRRSALPAAAAGGAAPSVLGGVPASVAGEAPSMPGEAPSSEVGELVGLVEACRAALERGVGTGVDAAGLVDLLAALEGLKSSACAVQGEAAVRLDDLERDRQRELGVPAARRGVGVAAQVGLARRESPHRAMVLLGAARVWAGEMPHTFAALRAGRLSEHRAVLLVQETACLELEDRREIDVLLCADPTTLAGVGTAAMVALVRRHAARLDPAALVRRARQAASERRVTLRPAPDQMAYLTAVLPVAQGVAAYAALCQAADGAGTANDDPGAAGVGVTGRPPTGEADAGAGAGERVPRSRGQVMADTLVERVTGQRVASAVPVTVDLVISDAALLGAGHEAAHLQGVGPVPAQVARELVAAGLDAGAAWLRRLYADPGGRLVAMSSRSRFHPDGLADFLRIRDQGICRTPYCDAPIRQIDHISPAAAGGVTSAVNGAGLCVACNLAKEAPGWRRHTLTGDPTDDDRSHLDNTAPGPGAPPGGHGSPIGGTSSGGPGSPGDDRSPIGYQPRGSGSPGADRPPIGYQPDGSGSPGADGTSRERRGGHVVRVVTPTGHEYLGRAPRAPLPAVSPAPAPATRSTPTRAFAAAGSVVDTGFASENSLVDLWFEDLVALFCEQAA